jgi:hypothetical protein
MALKLDSTLDVIPPLDKVRFVSKTSSRPFLNDLNVAA